MNLEAFYPEEAYPELYADVMTFHFFPDSKTFADAIPTLVPMEINAKYELTDRSNREQVRQFVDRWFVLPQENEVVPPTKADTTSQHISLLWDNLKREPDVTISLSSLISLPYPYIVPGGRFREIYYWDSYFTMLGLRLNGRVDIIHDMVKNFAWLIDRFGHIPNGNRSYFLSRSQPPFFSLMVTLLAEINGPSIFQAFLPQLLLEYAFWMDGADSHHELFRRVVRVGPEQYLNRYYDDHETPRAESWAEDVLLSGHATTHTNQLYRNLRAACESGWDFSSRWLGNENELASIRTTEFIPVDLNSLLYVLEKTIGKAYSIQGQREESLKFDIKADRRAALINNLLWDETRGVYLDHVPEQDNRPGSPTLAMMYPLFAGIASPMQAEKSIEFLSQHFLRPGGWVTTLRHTGQQWDAPNGWAPLQWITYKGLQRYHATALAAEGARRWLRLNDDVFKRTGRMMEKYNVEDLALEAGGGEYPVQDGFGWTNGVYLALVDELDKTGATIISKA